MTQSPSPAVRERVLRRHRWSCLAPVTALVTPAVALAHAAAETGPTPSRELLPVLATGLRFAPVAGRRPPLASRFVCPRLRRTGLGGLAPGARIGRAAVLDPHGRARAVDGRGGAVARARAAFAGAAGRLAAAGPPAGGALGRRTGAGPDVARRDRAGMRLDRAHAGVMGLACAGPVCRRAPFRGGARGAAPELPRRGAGLLVVAGGEPAWRERLWRGGAIAVRPRCNTGCSARC